MTRADRKAEADARRRAIGTEINTLIKKYYQEEYDRLFETITGELDDKAIDNLTEEAYRELVDSRISFKELIARAVKTIWDRDYARKPQEHHMFQDGFMMWERKFKGFMKARGETI